MRQRVRKPHRGQSPSSATQLPIPAALHARSPTLFEHMIHDIREKVNPFFQYFSGDTLFVGFPGKGGVQSKVL